MISARTTLRLGSGGALALALAACGGGPRIPATKPPAAAEVPPNELDAIIGLLDRGEAKAARKRIESALKRDPMDPTLLLLRDSIERDPVELLGPNAYDYETKPGDTMAGIATRLLGNRLKAYQLARYNGIDDPSTLAAGRTLRIPGQPPRAPAPARAEPAPVRRATPAAGPKPKPAPAPVAPVKSAPRPATNPTAAAQARRAGLAALNRGNAAQAVGLLRRAATLDPGNAVIARDLERAQRIARTVRERR